MTRPIITVDGITVRLRDRWLLGGLSWRIQAGEHWVIAGPNGAGKTTLAKAIAGLLPVVQGKIHYHAFADLTPTRAIAYIASDSRREIWRREQDLAHGRDFAGRFDAITPVGALLRGSAGAMDPAALAANDRFNDVVQRCDLEGLLNKPILSISTGEMARVLVARELLGQPRMLVLDEPFEGLDEPGRRALLAMLDGLAGAGLTLLLITHRLDELRPR
ncbi:ATP-binding cassette domain-containing protein [Desulfosarcina cetonica]|uniref:ATP-binding cassette domain-containing protein n=1 Tax=Desulfosarcina cetonica TaxID=90730 RepID=UPI0006D012FB|nr:ATP-binding cassette domain-containing protein [Desulfosarcina cetonica]